MDEDLKPKDAARALGVHVNTIKRWVWRGELPAYRISSRGDLRIRSADLEAFRVANLVQPTEGEEH